jgi:hypothetical protein
MACVTDRERCRPRTWFPSASRDDGIVGLDIAGEIAFIPYCGPFGTVGYRGTEDDEGCRRECLLAPLELLDMEEAVDILLEVQGRCV